MYRRGRRAAERTFVWTSDHESAFPMVKKALVTPPVLAQYNPDLPIMLSTEGAWVCFATATRSPKEASDVWI